MKNISKNFSLEEFTESNTAKSLGIDNTPNASQIKNLETLVIKLLQPVRDLYGKTMSINSGFRCKELNAAVGGSPTSDHMNGRSADVKVPNPRELFDLVRKSKLSFDQIILYPTFVHMSYRSDTSNRKQVLYAKGVKQSK